MNSNILGKITNKQSSDTGMAMTLIALLLGYFLNNNLFYKLSVPLLILTMAIPKIYKPAAFIWLGFSHYLGTVVSKILLSIVYLVLVIPVGFVRKIMGKDTLQLKNFKKNSSSVFLNRDYEFTGNDLEKPF